LEILLVARFGNALPGIIFEHNGVRSVC
jgi:hypothetical protein